MATAQVALPRKLWVGTYEFSVSVVPATDPKLEGDADGITYTGEHGCSIYIADHLDTRKRLEIVWHEVTHAINWVNDLDDDTDEEGMCQTHGIAWTAFLLDNPRFQRWLTSTINRIRKEQSKA